MCAPLAVPAGILYRRISPAAQIIIIQRTQPDIIAQKIARLSPVIAIFGPLRRCFYYFLALGPLVETMKSAQLIENK